MRKGLAELRFTQTLPAQKPKSSSCPFQTPCCHLVDIRLNCAVLGALQLQPRPRNKNRTVLQINQPKTKLSEAPELQLNALSGSSALPEQRRHSCSSQCCNTAKRVDVLREHSKVLPVCSDSGGIPLPSVNKEIISTTKLGISSK